MLFLFCRSVWSVGHSFAFTVCPNRILLLADARIRTQRSVVIAGHATNLVNHLSVLVFFWMHALCNSQEILIRARIFKLLRSPGINSKESIPPAYVAWRTGAKALFLLGSEAPIGCLKMPALVVNRLFWEPSSQNCVIKIRFLEVHSKKHLVEDNVTLKCSQLKLKRNIFVFWNWSLTTVSYFCRIGTAPSLFCSPL